MGYFSGPDQWVMGPGATPPPKWLMREFSKALQQMAVKREAAHAFDCKGVTFVVVMLPSDRQAAFETELTQAYRRAVDPNAQQIPRDNGADQSS